MAGAERPKRAVVVDADNPLVEIDGEFFWREDHEERSLPGNGIRRTAARTTTASEMAQPLLERPSS